MEKKELLAIDPFGVRGLVSRRPSSRSLSVTWTTASEPSDSMSSDVPPETAETSEVRLDLAPCPAPPS